jgi:hypothetical protein
MGVGTGRHQDDDVHPVITDRMHEFLLGEDRDRDSEVPTRRVLPGTRAPGEQDAQQQEGDGSYNKITALPPLPGTGTGLIVLSHRTPFLSIS